MNAICQFRKCTLTDDQLADEVERITDEMYFKTHEVPIRQIPARPDKDYDLLIGELIIRFKEKTMDTKYLISFGNYLLSEERNKSVSKKNRSNVTHADIENWKSTKTN